jgi:hypothetical protein
MPALHLFAVAAALLDLTSASLRLDFTQQRRPATPHHSKRYRKHSRRDAVNATIQNAQSNTLYLLNVIVGTPGQRMQLQLDTGSSDIWVPWTDSEICSADELCTEGSYDPGPSSTFNDVAPDAFDIEYVDGTKIQGDYIEETFGVGDVKVRDMTMGFAKTATINSQDVPFQGIVGVGFSAAEAITDDGTSPYPNLISMLKSEGHTDSLAYSLWLNDLGKHNILHSSRLHFAASWPTHANFPQRPAPAPSSSAPSTPRATRATSSLSRSSPTRTPSP